MKLSPREKLISGLALTGIVFAVLCLTFESQLKKLSTVKQQYREKELKLRRINKLLAEKEELVKELQRLEQGIPVKTTTAERQTMMMSSLDIAAKESSLVITSTQLTPIKPGDLYEELSANMQVECNLESLSKFLYRLQNVPQILDIRSLSLNPKGRDASLLRGAMRISTISLSNTKKEGTENSK